MTTATPDTFTPASIDHAALLARFMRPAPFVVPWETNDYYVCGECQDSGWANTKADFGASVTYCTCDEGRRHQAEDTLRELNERERERIDPPPY